MHRVFDTWSARLATPFRWLMVAGIAYTLATSLMTLLAGPGSTAPATPRTPGAPDRPARPALDIEPLLARNLFGIAGARPTATQTTAPAAVATQLPLELRGVFMADGDGISAAIIAQRGRPGQLYNVGQSIAGSATLEQVLADHVILRRAGVAETLHFPKPGQSQGFVAPTPAESEVPADIPYEEPAPGLEPYESIEEPPPAADEQPLDDAVSAYRERLDRDPEATLQSLGMTPVSAGSASGYRIDSLAASPYLGQTGLQPGDVILSVNGRPVGDLSQDRLEIDNVLAQGSARIEVQRGSRRFFVTASLP